MVGGIANLNSFLVSRLFTFFHIFQWSLCLDFCCQIVWSTGTPKTYKHKIKEEKNVRHKTHN